jgi:hypothetical protein
VWHVACLAQFGSFGARRDVHVQPLSHVKLRVPLRCRLLSCAEQRRVLRLQ